MPQDSEKYMSEDQSGTDIEKNADRKIFIPGAMGERITYLRKRKKMTQAQLAEATGCGVTHISHIETGNTIPSLQLMLDIINVLGCSADELLCIEVDKARPIYESWLNEQLADCSRQEVKLISDVVLGLKASLRRLEFSAEE